MNATRALPTTLCMVSILLAAAGPAWAQGVGNLASLPTQFQTTAPPTGFTIINPAGGPIPVERDPLGPVWPKHLTGPNGQPFQAAAFQAFPVQEALLVAGTLPWKDWHAEIVNPNWSWTAPSILVNGAVPSGLTITNIPGNALEGGSLSFNFDPVAPGSTVIIAQTLLYTGPPAVFNGTVRVNQYPTPEPASCLLLAAGSVLALGRRHRSAHGA